MSACRFLTYLAVFAAVIVLTYILVSRHRLAVRERHDRIADRWRDDEGGGDDY